MPLVQGKDQVVPGRPYGRGVVRRAVEGRKDIGRYYVQNHQDEIDGYLRPTSYGWRAIVGVCPKGRQPCGWARGGRVVRVTRDARVLHVYSDGSPGRTGLRF